MILLILLGGAIFSCRQEFSDLLDTMADDSAAINEAREWYEGNNPQWVSLKNAAFKEQKLNARPDWKYAYAKKHKDFTTVQVPISTQGRFGFTTPENRQAFEQTGDNRYMNSLTQMVIVTEKENNNTIGFLMTIIPDKKYLESTKFKAFYSSYKSWQKGFCGYILYHTLEGVFANGWYLADGEAVKTVQQGNFPDIDMQLKSVTDCYDYYWVAWYQNCTDWYTQTETSTTYNGTTCGEPYSESTYLYTSCGYTSSSGGGGYYTSPESTVPCDCNTCPSCGGCMTDANSSGCPPRCPGHGTLGPIQGNVYLDPTQLELLERALINLETENCLTNSTYTSLVNNDFRINFSMENIENPAAYDPYTKTIYFRENYTITSENMKEELYHAYQDSYYQGGISQYLYYGKVNIEFEAKVYKDIMSFGCCYIFSNINIPSDIIAGYVFWIQDIKDNNYSFSDSDYQYWLNLFNQYHPEYSSPFNPNLSTPNALRSIISSSINCLN